MKPEERNDLDEQIKVAKEEFESKVTVRFRKPIKYEGEIYEEITFDFERLTGRDSLAIEEELAMIGKPLVVPSLSGPYLVRMAMKACDKPVGIDFFDMLSLRDFSRIRSAARSFLLASE